MHHAYEHLPATRQTAHKVKQEALDWLEEYSATFMETHPAAWPQPCCIISDKEAQSIRYRDGRKVYSDEGW